MTPLSPHAVMEDEVPDLPVDPTNPTNEPTHEASAAELQRIVRIDPPETAAGSASDSAPSDPSTPEGSAPDETAPVETGADGIGIDDVEAPGAEDLESAYRRALEALESAESAVGQAFDELHAPQDPESNEAAAAESDAHTSSAPQGAPDDESNAANASTAPQSEATHDAPSAVLEAPSDRPSPLGIVEAALFVGGTPLTTKKLTRLLNDEFDQDAIANFVARLNERYTRERRPYEIDFGEGGYRLRLRSDFEDVRNRVYGLGPREVKLSQPALEVLALVAYHQPIAREEVSEHVGKSGLTILRQLVRRELVEVARVEDDPEVRYRTTKRFLEVFGVSDLDELPRPAELEFK